MSVVQYNPESLMHVVRTTVYLFLWWLMSFFPEEKRRGGDIIDGVLCYCLFFIAVRCSIIEEEGEE